MGKVSGWSGAHINHIMLGHRGLPLGEGDVELILEGTSRSVDLRPFDPARFASSGGGRGGRGWKKGTVNVGELW